VRSDDARVGAVVEWFMSGRPKRGTIKSIAENGNIFVVSPRRPYQRGGRTIRGEGTRCFTATDLGALVLVAADAASGGPISAE
jgi:hypothetical protein